MAVIAQVNRAKGRVGNVRGQSADCREAEYNCHGQSNAFAMCLWFALRIRPRKNERGISSALARAPSRSISCVQPALANMAPRLASASA